MLHPVVALFLTRLPCGWREPAPAAAPAWKISTRHSLSAAPAPSPASRSFALLSIVLLFADARLQYLEHIREAVSVALYPLERAARAPGAALIRLAAFFSAQSTLIEENEALRLKTLELGAKPPGWKPSRPRRASCASCSPPPSGATSPCSWARSFMRSATLSPARSWSTAVRSMACGRDKPSSTRSGLVGQVTRVLPLASEVTLITDKNQAVPVQNLRTGARSVVFGVGRDDVLELRFMPINVDIQVGDTLVTSGIDGLYPDGFPGGNRGVRRSQRDERVRAHRVCAERRA